MEDKIYESAQTGAFTLMLLVQNYRSQMIALLLKNGITVPSDASEDKIVAIMVNLLKISKSFYKDITLFIQNPKVLNNLEGAILKNAEYLKVEGYSFNNLPSFNENFFKTKDSATNTVKDSVTTPPKKGFFSGLNLGDIIKDGLGAFSSMDTNKTNRIIAEARVKAGLPPLNEEIFFDENGVVKKKSPDDEGISTTTIVVLSLVGIAVIGTIIYFATRPKN